MNSIPESIKDKLYAACLAILNNEGVAALGLEKLCQQAKLEKADFQQYISGLNDIYDLIQDELYRHINEENFETTSWKTHLKDYAYLIKDAISACPPLVEILSIRPSVTPNALKHTDASYAILMNAGFSSVQADFINHGVGVFVMGICMAAFGKSQVAASFPSPETLKELYPNLYNGFIHQDWDHYFENMLDVGLDSMLDGFEKMLPQSS